MREIYLTHGEHRSRKPYKRSLWRPGDDDEAVKDCESSDQNTDDQVLTEPEFQRAVDACLKREADDKDYEESNVSLDE